MKKWIRYRFYTKAIDDYRPLIFNPKYPWWCSGFTGLGIQGEDSSIIIAYLPLGENLLEYWDDAYDIEEEEHEKIIFTGRFPKPDYFDN